MYFDEYMIVLYSKALSFEPNYDRNNYFLVIKVIVVVIKKMIKRTTG